MTVVGYVLVLAGVVLTLIAAVGVVRLPDLFSRLHAGTKATSAGVALLLVGTAFLLPAADVAVKVVIAIAFQFLTAPVAAHVVGRAAYLAGVPRQTPVDELAERLESIRHSDEE